VAAADNFPSASFAGIKFPYVDRTVRGSDRHHVHEYPHTHGGVQEPLGRRLYEFDFTCDFDESMSGVFPALYPRTVVELFAVFGEERVADLVVPGIGTFSARCINWEARKVAKIRSGEKLTFKFLEVLDVIIVDPSAVAIPSLPAEAATVYTLVRALQAAPLGALPPAARPTPIDVANAEKFQALVNAFVAADSANDFAALGAAQGVLTFGQKMDGAPYLRYARAFGIVESIHRIAAAANSSRKDIQKKSRPVLAYTTTRRTSITEVSTTLFGNTSHTRELMLMNDLDDALHIRPGTRINYYQPDKAA
jgi:hypothetical protein